MSGVISLINSTPFDWTLGFHHEYQLSGWNWPRTVPAFSSAAVPVSFDEDFVDQLEDDSGEATYYISGTDGCE
jgi:hypothetical protein